jgi:hypothetical protein
LPSDTREVYSIIIQKTAHDDANIGDITHLLDTYDRDKRFDKVLPLTEAQFESRYELLDMLDSNDEHSTYQANDNLLATAVTLAIYHAHPSAEYYNKLNKATLAHLFKVQFGEKLSLGRCDANRRRNHKPRSYRRTCYGRYRYYCRRRYCCCC